MVIWQIHKLPELMNFLLWSVPWASSHQDRFLCRFFGFLWMDRNDYKCYKQIWQPETAGKPLANSSAQPIITGRNSQLISLIKISANLAFLSCLLLDELKWSTGAHPTWVLILLQPKSRPLTVSPSSLILLPDHHGKQLDHIWVWELNLFQ